MELFKSTQEILDFIKKQKTSSLHISTFGINFKPEQLDFTIHIKKKSILIGLPKVKYCKAGCVDCTTRHIAGMKFNIINMVELQSLGFDVYYSYENHMKAFIFGMKAVIGGINMTNSGYTDLSILTHRKYIQKDYFKYRDQAQKFISPEQFAAHIKKEFWPFDYRSAVFRFGKFKGRVINDVGKSIHAQDYIEWYKNTIFDLTLKNEKKHD